MSTDFLQSLNIRYRLTACPFSSASFTTIFQSKKRPDWYFVKISVTASSICFLLFHFLVPTLPLRAPRAFMGVIITSARSPEEWQALFPDPILGNSSLDRLAHSSYQILMDGPSLREQDRPK